MISATPEKTLLRVKEKEEEDGAGIFDVRLNLKGKNGGSVVLELNSEVLSASSEVFAALITDFRNGLSGAAPNLCRIEVPEVQNFSAFRETIELMFEDDIPRQLLKIGVYRSIDILEVTLEDRASVSSVIFATSHFP
ncbi:hypothetical protein RJ640_014568 [Escallonia rubra]|uniref:BTB domain-containing protein n=1 Tax=Escallonia rubra TaxID=112253 RepID=A0AA88RXM7_9ASTE|nr:hypothetical protein RJ640_014568 [Escallonia rubra]